MTISSFDRRSNVFGSITSSAGRMEIPFIYDPSKSEAYNLIEKLKVIADNQLSNMAASVDWLGLAANQGQNASAPTKSLVGYTNVLPDDITKDNYFKGWTAPELSPFPSLPALPPELKVDMGVFKADIDALIAKLQTSWMAKFLPATTDISKYDSLMKDILGGTNETQITTKLDAILSAMQTDLGAVKNAALSDVTTQINAMYTALAANIAGIQPKIDAAIKTAQDNTGNIVFARGRDQIAREAARQEAEVTALWAAKGWSMPNGVLAQQQASARQNTLDAAAKIAAEEAVRTQMMNVDFAKQGIDAWLRSADLTLRSNVEGMKSALEARLRYSQMQIEADRTVAEQSMKNLGLRLDFTKFSGDFARQYRKDAVDGMNNLLSAYASLARNEIEYYTAIAGAQRANIEALINYYRLAMAEVEMGVKVQEANIETKLKWATIAGSFIAQCVGHHVQAASATGQMYAQAAGMALSGLNGIASTSIAS